MPCFAVTYHKHAKVKKNLRRIIGVATKGKEVSEKK